MARQTVHQQLVLAQALLVVMDAGVVLGLATHH